MTYGERHFGESDEGFAATPESGLKSEAGQDSPKDTRPEIPVPGGDADVLAERCAHERDRLTPHETADCAGARTAELYERDEDGGS